MFSKFFLSLWTSHLCMYRWKSLRFQNISKRIWCTSAKYHQNPITHSRVQTKQFFILNTVIVTPWRTVVLKNLFLMCLLFQDDPCFFPIEEEELFLKGLRNSLWITDYRFNELSFCVSGKKLFSCKYFVLVPLHLLLLFNFWANKNIWSV